MADHDSKDTGSHYPLGDPSHVRALDAFETFYRQVGRVLSLAQVFETALRTTSAHWIVLAAAELNQGWSLLDARLEMLEAVTNDDAGRELWTLPTMHLARDASRKAMALAVQYVRTHEHGAAQLLVQLKQLGARLEVHARLAAEVSVATIARRPANSGAVLSPVLLQVTGVPDGLQASPQRCHMRRPARHRRYLPRSSATRNAGSSEAS